MKILDENDNKPQFLQKFYKIRLPEREKADGERNARREPLYRVIAADKDEGPNAELSYSIEEGNEHGRFSIEPRTGVVSSKKLSAAGEYDILSVSWMSLLPFWEHKPCSSFSLVEKATGGVWKRLESVGLFSLSAPTPVAVAMQHAFLLPSIEHNAVF